MEARLMSSVSRLRYPRQVSPTLSRAARAVSGACADLDARYLSSRRDRYLASRSARFCAGVVGGVVLVGVLSGCGSAKAKGGGFDPSGTAGAGAGGTPGAASTGGVPGAAAGPVAPPLPAPSTMTAPQLRQSVLDGYKSYMAASEAAYETNNTSSLGQYAIDPILSRVTQDIQADAAKGVIWRFHNVLNPQLQGWSKDKTLVVVLDCLQNLGSYEYSLANGARVSIKKTANSYYQAHLKYIQGVWKITDAKVGSRC
jgi:hypothetical protein